MCDERVIKKGKIPLFNKKYHLKGLLKRVKCPFLIG